MTTTNLYNQVYDNFGKLGLSQMQLHFSEISDDITSNRISVSEGLLKLTNYQIDYKAQNTAISLVRAAVFPFLKELKDYDFQFQPSINKQKILELATLSFLEKHENIIFLGSSGVGKTHLATSLGIISVKQKNRTYFIKCNDLFLQLKKAKLENRLESKLKIYAKYRLLDIDEIGYLPINKEDSNLFFQLIDMRYENKSTIFFDVVTANAILDKILHHSHVITISGNSRLKDIAELKN